MVCAGARHSGSSQTKTFRCDAGLMLNNQACHPWRNPQINRLTTTTHLWFNRVKRWNEIDPAGGGRRNEGRAGGKTRDGELRPKQRQGETGELQRLAHGSFPRCGTLLWPLSVCHPFYFFTDHMQRGTALYYKMFLSTERKSARH